MVVLGLVLFTSIWLCFLVGFPGAYFRFPGWVLFLSIGALFVLGSLSRVDVLLKTHTTPKAWTATVMAIVATMFTAEVIRIVVSEQGVMASDVIVRTIFLVLVGLLLSDVSWELFLRFRHDKQR